MQTKPEPRPSMEAAREGGCKPQTKRAGEFFSRLSASSLEDFSAMEYLRAYEANVVVFRERDPGRALFVILGGAVRLSIDSIHGRRLSMRIAKRGEIIGLSSSLSGTPYGMTAETLNSSKIAVIDRWEFQQFLARHPDAYLSVTEELGRHIALACSQLRTLGLSSSAQQKLARLLLEWSDSGAMEPESRLHLSLTHSEIGDFIGSSRETVTRTLSDLKNRRLVSFRGCMMTIPNRAALENYAYS